MVGGSHARKRVSISCTLAVAKEHVDLLAERLERWSTGPEVLDLLLPISRCPIDAPDEQAFLVRDDGLPEHHERLSHRLHRRMEGPYETSSAPS